jgi:hypothetical protein
MHIVSKKEKWMSNGGVGEITLAPLNLSLLSYYND